jgi:leucyl aminopeptidase
MPTFVAMKWTFASSASTGHVTAVVKPTSSEFSTDLATLIEARAERGVKGWLHQVAGAEQFVRVLTSKGDAAEMAHSGRKAGAELAGLLSKNKISNLSLEAGDATFHVAEGLALAAYRYTRLLGKKAKEAWTLDSVEVVGLSAGDAKRLEVLMAAVTEARDLINTPVLDLTAEDLAARAEELGQIYGFKVTVLNQAKIESLKMGGLLGVNKGSVDPATFSILEYKPEKAVNSAPYVLVGKGVVYDTGGLSLKPSNFMDTMKCDMS